MDPSDRQTFRVRLLGGPAGGFKQFSGDARLGGHISSFTRSWLEPANLDRIVREWAPRLVLSEAEIRAYLTNSIYYDLDPACLEGLQLFYRYAGECGALRGRRYCAFLRWRTLQPRKSILGVLLASDKLSLT